MANRLEAPTLRHAKRSAEQASDLDNLDGYLPALLSSNGVSPLHRGEREGRGVWASARDRESSPTER